MKRKEQQKKLRIVILVRRFPNIIQTYVLNHILSMKKAGHDVLVAAEGISDHSEVHPAVYRYRLLDNTIYINSELDQFVRQVFHTPFTSPDYLRAILKMVFSGAWLRHGSKYAVKSLLHAKVLAFGVPDIVHSHSLFTSYNYLFLREIFSIPSVTTFHGLVPNNVRMLERDKLCRVLQAGDAFIVNTRFARDQLLAFECPREKIHIIPQGTNLEDFPFKARSIDTGKPIVILSVGRLSVEKGFQIAIRAVARLGSRFPNIEYRIIGNGVYEQELRDLMELLGVQDRVSLRGLVDADELRHQYEQASIFILPSIDLRDGSHTETQGVVLQEAQASGIPVIASRTGGIPEVIVDRNTGLIFDEGDDEGLAASIETLILDGDLYRNISMQARRDVEDNFSIEVIRDRLTDVYTRVINRERPD